MATRAADLNPSDLLQQLYDIETAPDPHWWPPAIGWWLLGLILIWLLSYLIWHSYRFLRRWQRRRAILQQVQQVFAHSPETELLPELSRLLRRLALTAAGREQVASLHGTAWLQYLDQTAATNQFSQGPGRVLMTAPYQPNWTATDQALQRLIERWVRHNF